MGDTLVLLNARAGALIDIGADRVHKHLIPGHGVIDLSATLSAIAASGYDGWVTVELYPYVDRPQDAAREAYSYVTGLLGQLGIPVE